MTQGLLSRPARPTRTAARAVPAPTRLRAPGAPTAVLGHMGAPVVAPPNTAESFLAARRLGADGLELDLLAVSRGKVVVAHDLGEFARRPDALDLDGLSDLLAAGPLADAPVLLDVKSLGAERALSAAMVGARLAPRSIVSTTDPAVLRAVRRAIPGATRSQTFPRSRRDPERHVVSRCLARARRPVTRLLMPLIVRRADLRSDLHAVVVHHPLVTPALRRLTVQRGIELVAWTVDDAATATRMLDLGVDAIITNDPETILAVRREHPATISRTIEDRRKATSVAPPRRAR